MMEDYANFLKVIEDLKFYMVEFKEDETMKPKVYLNNYIVEDPNQRLVIIITHDKYIFFVNNGVQQI